MQAGAATIRECARTLGVSRRTVQSWIAAGAPVARPGRRGRGGDALLDPEALRRWRARGGAPEAIDVDALDRALWNAFTRAPEGSDRPAWAELGLSRRQAGALLIETYQAIHLELTGRPPDMLPPKCEAILRICVG